MKTKTGNTSIKFDSWYLSLGITNQQQQQQQQLQHNHIFSWEFFSRENDKARNSSIDICYFIHLCMHIIYTHYYYAL